MNKRDNTEPLSAEKDERFSASDVMKSRRDIAEDFSPHLHTLNFSSVVRSEIPTFSLTRGMKKKKKLEIENANSLSN